MNLLIIYIIAAIISSALGYYLEKTALGYEDEEGFHYRGKVFTSKEEAEEYAKSLVEGPTNEN